MLSVDGFLVMQVISLDTIVVAMVPLVEQMLFFFFMYGNNFWKNLFYQSITTYRNVQKSLMYSFMKFHKVKVQITPGPKEQPKAPNSPKGKYYPDF